MSEASAKQTAVLLKNGFSQEQIDKMNKKAISDEIGKIFGNNDKSSGNPGVSKETAKAGATEGIGEVRHIFQSSYECGPAGNRHTIKYFTLEELKQKKEALENMGLLDPTLS